MKCAPGKSQAASMLVVALTTRMFWGLSLDVPYALNAVWMCPLVGLVLYLPLAFAISRAGALESGSPLDNLSHRAPRGMSLAVEIFFTSLLLWDYAATVRLTASSSNVIALSDVSVPVLTLPLAIVAGIAVLLGADAEGNSARIWLRLAPLLLLIVLIVQLRSYNAGWLTPVLGGGTASIVDGGIFCAGAMSLLSLPWIVAVPDRNDRGALRYVALAATASSVMLISEQMLCPLQIKNALTRVARIELVLSNGRLMLSPQLVVNILWYGSLLHQISTEAATASVYLSRVCPGAPVWCWSLLVFASSLVLPGWDPPALRAYLGWAGMLFVAIGLALALMMTAATLGKEERKT